MLLMFVKWYSGHIFNQLRDHNKLKEEVDITDAAHKAYYKENRAQNACFTEKINCCPLYNFFKNCYISGVDLEQTLSKISDIEIGSKAEE